MDTHKVKQQLEDRCVPVPEDGCWIWLDKRKPAQRTSWRLKHGCKPAGRHIACTCKREDCVNPEHLIAS